MKLYLDTKKMTFKEENNEIEHELIISIVEKPFIGCDEFISLSANDKFIKDTFSVEKIGEDKIRQFAITADGWFSFPLYEFKDNKIVPFDHTKYQYFTNTDRRVSLAFKINESYNQSSEAKILRKTIKKILDNLGIIDEKFEKYNTRVEKIIEKNPKNNK